MSLFLVIISLFSINFQLLHTSILTSVLENINHTGIISQLDLFVKLGALNCYASEVINFAHNSEAKYHQLLLFTIM